MKYQVKYFTEVRVDAGPVEAISAKEAALLVDGVLGRELGDFLRSDRKRSFLSHPAFAVRGFEWTQGAPLSMLVDPLLDSGDVDYSNSEWLDHNGEPLDVKEAKGNGAELARLFFRELIDSVETLSGVGDKFGADTVANLMWLQNAILSGNWADFSGDETLPSVLEILDGLPSGSLWRSYLSPKTISAAA